MNTAVHSTPMGSVAILSTPITRMSESNGYRISSASAPTPRSAVAVCRKRARRRVSANSTQVKLKRQADLQ